MIGLKYNFYINGQGHGSWVNLYLSRFGVRASLSLGLGFVGGEGVNPVKPDPPISLGFFFFLWLSFRWTCMFLTVIPQIEHFSSAILSSEI